MTRRPGNTKRFLIEALLLLAVAFGSGRLGVSPLGIFGAVVVTWLLIALYEHQHATGGVPAAEVPLERFELPSPEETPQAGPTPLANMLGYLGHPPEPAGDSTTSESTVGEAEAPEIPVVSETAETPVEAPASLSTIMGYIDRPDANDAQAEAEQAEAERLATAARLEAQRVAEEERLEAARIETERVAEEERLEAARAEAARVEAERLEVQRRAEEERLEAARAEVARVEAERVAEEERLEAARAEAARVEAERIAEEERVEAERAEAARVEAERAAEAERVEAEQAEAARLEAERIAEEERVEAARAAENIADQKGSRRPWGRKRRLEAVPELPVEVEALEEITEVVDDVVVAPALGAEEPLYDQVIPHFDPSQLPDAPQQWNLWELETLSKQLDDEQRIEELNYLLFYLRDYAAADGQLDESFDELVRESFGDLLLAQQLVHAR